MILLPLMIHQKHLSSKIGSYLNLSSDHYFPAYLTGPSPHLKPSLILQHPHRLESSLSISSISSKSICMCRCHPFSPQPWIVSI